MICSIFTPSYKRKYFLEQFHKNLKNYLIKYNFEWIVPLEEDDTESIKFMRSIKSTRIRPVIGKFGGSAKAFSKCIKFAKGEYVSFSGDDDYRTEDFFKYICKYNGKNLIIGHGKYISNEGKPIRTISTNIKKFFFNFYSYNTLRTVNYLSSPSVIYRRKIIIREKCLRHKKYPWTNDYELSLRLAKQYKPIIVNKVFSQNTYNSNTITGTFNFKKITELIKLSWAYNKFSIYFFISLFFISIITIFNLTKIKINKKIKKNFYLKIIRIK